MIDVLIGGMLTALGAMLGSFAGAQVWRLRARQLKEEKAAGESVDMAEYSRLLPLTETSLMRDRSIDLDTGQQLAWYDLLPIVSWLMLRGKSRYSGKSIGYFELVIELGVAAFFVVSYIAWQQPLDSVIAISQFAIWLAAGVALAIQFATDYKWKILWTLLSRIIIGLGLAYAVLEIAAAPEMLPALYSMAGSVLILGGLYYVLYAVSREQWVGLGDVFLGIGLGLLLADWQLAFIALFTANLIGCIVVLGGFALKKLSRRQHVPFGPFFILGAVVAQLWGSEIVSAYMALLLP